MVDTAGHTPILTPAALRPSAVDDAARAKQEQILALQKQVDECIAAIQSASLPIDASLRHQVIAQLNAARRGGDPTALNNAIAVANQVAVTATGQAITKQLLAQANIEGEMWDMEGSYPGWNGYNAAAKSFIRDQMKFAMTHSETAANAAKEFESIPKEIKQAVFVTQKQNAQGWESFKAEHSEFFRNPEGQTLDRLFNDYNMAKDRRCEFIKELVRKGDTTEAVRVAVEVMRDQIKTVADTYKEVRNNLDPIQDKGTIEYFDNNNGSKAMSEWHAIRKGARNDAFLELQKANGDVSKLSNEHQKTVNIAKIMVVVERTNAFKAVSEMAKDQTLLVTLENKSADRVGAILDYMHNHSNVTADIGARQKTAESMIELIDKNPKALALLRNGSEESMNALGELMRQHRNEIDRAEGRSVDGSIGTAAINLIVDSRNDFYEGIRNGDIPDRLKKNPERLAAIRAKANEWEQVQARIHSGYTEHMVALAEEKSKPVAPKTAEERALEEATLAANPMKQYLDSFALAKKSETQATTVSVSTNSGDGLSTIPGFPPGSVSGGADVASIGNPPGGKRPTQGVGMSPTA
jgi:hypothetical protein